MEIVQKLIIFVPPRTCVQFAEFRGSTSNRDIARRAPSPAVALEQVLIARGDR
ncbi:hypothetical protein G4X40_15010 [Rhodococcus sp. D2-41]|uniref:Uncharacterized protein n=1 Tax=Speluncibacter jeojiensis TaxID=2710754 RepID=A0A9X4RE33_9ACTN|nr:hypothetical protein [Rhodococcus sp. D2-41]MDG3011456.1 hypothetical protein [Rhodococcus sp. D2-41]MDG3015188.1 hypothetical protein [Corynebacteriales bacterium D3-21]